jgi:transcriptional regulator
MIAMTEFLEGTNQKFVLEKESTRMQRSIKYIQAFDITITSWEGKFKLSQDKNKQDQENAKLELIKKSGKDISSFIEEVYDLSK